MRKMIVLFLVLTVFSVLFAQQDYEPGIILLQVNQPDVVAFSNGKIMKGSQKLQTVFQQYPANNVIKLSHVNVETDGCYRIEFPVDFPLKTIRDAISKCPDIKYVNLAYYGVLSGEPNDPLWDYQWALDKIKMEHAWDITKPNRTILVGIMDSGIDSSHEDLKDNIWTNPNEIPGDSIDNDSNNYVDDIYGWDWVYNDNDPQDEYGGVGGAKYHGTRVAGVIAAKTYNQKGIAGIAGGWQDQVGVRLIALKIANEDGLWVEYQAKRAIDYLTWLKQNYGYTIIANMSFQTTGGDDEPMPILEASINAAKQAGVILISAAGNTMGDDPEKDPYYYPEVDTLPIPARYSGVLAIGASKDGADIDDEVRSDYSLYVTEPDEKWVLASAPVDDNISSGINIYTTYPDNIYINWFNGTSAACPIVTGVVSLILSVNPSLSYSQISNILGETAEKIGNYNYGSSGRTAEVGYGRINAYEALRYTLENYGGTLRGDVLLSGDLTIKAGVTLIIEPGTTITFAANQDDQNSGLDNSRSELTIQGKIEADGVTFTSSSSTANSWYGIILDGPTYTSYIKNSTIQWAKRGIIVDDCSPTIQGNDLDNNQYGIWVHGSSSYPVVKQNDINNGVLPLVVSSDAEPWIYDNKSRGLNNCLYIASGGYPDVRNNTLYGYANGTYQIYITGSNSGITTASSSGNGNYLTDDVSNDIVLIDGGSDFVFEYDVFENVSSASYDYIDNNDATQCDAENCYWDDGGVPSSSYFDGNVDYTPVLASEPSAGATWKLVATSPTPFESGFLAYKNKNYEYAASELRAAFENNYDHEDAHRALFYISRSAMRISEKVPYLTFFEEIIKSLYDEESKQIARSALMRNYARNGQLSKSESYAMHAPRGTLYDRELLLDMVYYYSLYEDEVGESRVIAVLTEVYGDDKSIEQAIENVKLLIEDERKLMKMSPAGEGPANSGVENTSNENLLTAFPNPFNPSTTIRYTLNEPGNVTLKIYNIKGQQVAVLVNGHQDAGAHEIVFSTTDLPSGIYFYQLTGKDINIVKKIMLLK